MFFYTVFFLFTIKENYDDVVVDVDSKGGPPKNNNIWEKSEYVLFFFIFYLYYCYLCSRTLCFVGDTF